MLENERAAKLGKFALSGPKARGCAAKLLKHG
jgi:hypothetical protein